MELRIEEVCLELNHQKSGKEKLHAEEINKDGAFTEYRFWGEKSRAVLIVQEENMFLKGEIRVELENEAFRENDNLAFWEPVRIELRLQREPRQMTAMYLHRDWWTRPAFIRGFGRMPERTQSVYMEFEEYQSYLLPLAGTCYKTYASPGREGVLALTMTAYQSGKNELREPVFLLSQGENIYDAIRTAFTEVSTERSLPLREKRDYPEMFEYLGWCSWDAFYTEISEDKVREKARELTEKQVPVRWFLMDDGWLSVHGMRLYDLMPEKEKFPGGFASMIREIKEESRIDWFGVWHAFGGYWGGLEPESKAALDEKDHLFETVNGKLLPHPTPETGYGFFRDWYERLRAEEIDFVKVDGQSAIKNYYENSLPVCSAAKGTHEALEGAAAVYMNGRMINCMGMAMENILGRPGSAITRNSDDFVPDSETGFAEHLLQNCYNALYQDMFYYCDWDMFWTSHPDAEKHGILRAVSGGPIYFSDRIGETSENAVEPLVYRDGRILRMERTAKPSLDCIFRNPLEEGLLKITNVAAYGEKRKAGAVAVYNISAGEGSIEVNSSDIYDLPRGSYYLYNWKSREGISLKETEGKEVILPEDGCALLLMLPSGKKVTPVGLLEKYISFHGIEAIVETEGSQTIVLREGGLFGFHTTAPVRNIYIDGKDCTHRASEKKGLWKIETETDEKTIVTIITD